MIRVVKFQLYILEAGKIRICSAAEKGHRMADLTTTFGHPNLKEIEEMKNDMQKICVVLQY